MFRLLLRLFPASFRDRYSSELLDTFDQETAARRGFSLLHRARWIVGALVDVAVCAGRERAGGGIDAVATRKAERRRIGEVARSARPRGIDGLVTQLQDLRQAIRGLRKSPGFSLVVVLTLAMGIGANTAVFSVLNGLFLRDLPFPRAHELVVAVLQNPRDGVRQGPVGYADYLRWRDRTDVFRSLGLYVDWGFNITGPERPSRIRAAIVAYGFFDVLETPPVLGRVFGPEEHERGQGAVAVLSQGLWARSYGSDPAILGATIHLDGEPYQVIGIMPTQARWPREADVWIPLPFGAGTPPSQVLEMDALAYSVIGRLQPWTSRSGATAVANALAEEAALARPDTRAGFGARVIPLRTYIAGERTVRALWLLLGCVGLVLLIACANVSNLTLERTLGRKREIAVRIALGAGRARSTRPLLGECLILTVVGAGAGLALAYLGTEALVALAPSDIPGLKSVGVDGRVLAFTLVVSLVAGLLSGLFPILGAVRLDLVSGLRESRQSGQGRRARRLMRSLTAAQIGVSVVLVLGAGLVGKSTGRLLRVDPGFRPEGLLSLRLDYPHYRPGSPEEQRLPLLFQQFTRRLVQLPGAVSAAAVSALPLSPQGLFDNLPFAVEGEGESGVTHFANTVLADPSLFETLEVPLMSGRHFTELDGPDAEPVVIISESLARETFPSQDPIGRRIRSTSDILGQATFRVAGVVGDVRYTDFADVGRSIAYLPLAQVPWRAMALVVRFRGDPTRRISEVQEAIRGVDPTVPVSQIRPMAQVAADALAAPRLGASLLTAFSFLALALAVVGVYGVVTYSLRLRAHELGVRRALGAPREELRKCIFAEALRLAIFGMLLGLPAGLAGARLLSNFLYEVGPADPGALLGAPALLLAAILGMASIPALRAARIDPVEALRQE